VQARWIIVLVPAVVPAFGQLESNTITISATRWIDPQPDGIALGLSVTSGVNAGLDQIVAALAGLGITATNLTGVSNQVPMTLQWSFTLVVPFSSLTQTIGAVTKLQQTITANNSGLTLAFGINGTQASPQVRHSQSCSTSNLVADATAQAQKLASAAGLSIGPILKLSNGPSIQPYAVPTIATRVGDFVSSDFRLGSPLPVTCSLVVEFQLHP
jgi:hypothetical protein